MTFLNNIMRTEKARNSSTDKHFDPEEIGSTSIHILPVELVIGPHRESKSSKYLELEDNR